MTSVWVLKFDNKRYQVMSEEEYAKYACGTRLIDINGGFLIYEEHWFDVENAKRKYASKMWQLK